MKPRSFFTPVISACLLLLSGAPSAAEFDSQMKLRADAPGGAFTDREALTFRLVNNTPRPETYTVENRKGEIVAQGEWPAGDAPLTLKALPHGHYLLKTAPGACAFAVLPDPAARRVPADAPFNLDTHISWTGGDNASAGYPGEAGYRFIAELGRRAGAGFLRDRISWGPVNPARGEFRFDGSWNRSAAAVHAAGLRMLSVYHDAPAWTKDDPKKRMPTDLFAVYEFNRRLARHFRGKIDFWEFWNEQDIGFSDAAAWDYAAAMKAAYLGFKAGNPDITVLTGPFCVDTPAGFCRAALKSDLPQYFDVFSYHTYASPDNFPKLLEQIRQVLKEQKGLALPHPMQPCALLTLHDDSNAAVRGFDDLQNMTNRADLVQILLAWLGGTDLPLGHEEQPPVVLHGVVQRIDGYLPLHVEGQRLMGEGRQPPQGQHGYVHGDTFHMYSFLSERRKRRSADASPLFRIVKRPVRFAFPPSRS